MVYNKIIKNETTKKERKDVMKKRKLMALLLAGGMVTSMLAGCGNGTESAGNDQSAGTEEEESSQDNENEGKVLTMMTYIDPNGGDATQEKVWEVYQRFTEETGIEIELNVVPWDQTESKVVITNQAGSPCDIALISSQKMPSLVNSGALLSLDEMIDADMNRDEISDAVWNAGTYSGDGKVYCLLSSVHSRGLWYNKDYVQDPPETWDELVSTAQQVMEENEDVYGFGFWGGKHYGSGETAIAPFSWAGGGTLANDDGSAAWANDAVADAIRFMSDCVNEYKITPEMCLNVSDYNDVTQQFAAGNIAMILDGSYAKTGIETGSGDISKFGFVPYPAKEEGGERPFFTNGWAWAIPSKSKQPELAWEFIKWFYGKDVQIDHSKVEGGLPVTKEAQEDPEIMAGELEKAFIENINANGRSMDPFSYYQEGLEQLAVASATYCLDPGSDLDALLEEAQNAFIEKYYSE